MLLRDGNVPLPVHFFIALKKQLFSGPFWKNTQGASSLMVCNKSVLTLLPSQTSSLNTLPRQFQQLHFIYCRPSLQPVFKEPSPQHLRTGSMGACQDIDYQPFLLITPIQLYPPPPTHTLYSQNLHDPSPHTAHPFLLVHIS